MYLQDRLALSEYAIDCVKNGKAIDTDWTGTLSTGSVVLTDVNTKAAAEGTQAKIDEVKAELEGGKLHVFDTSAFTVTVSDSKTRMLLLMLTVILPDTRLILTPMQITPVILRSFLTVTSMSQKSVLLLASMYR